MLRHTLLAAATLSLCACAGIAHDTPEARQQIKHDLKLQQIDATATMSYCKFPIGSIALCKATPGIGVLTANKLLMVDYANGAYKQDGVLTTQDVRCISDSDGHWFYVFTENQAIALIPYTNTGAKRNPAFRNSAIKTLLANGQPLLTGAESNFIRETDKRHYSVSTLNVSGTPVPIVSSSSYGEIFSPCAESKQ
ncbi:hypothetical protein [Pseudomonas huaxiensis]|uniref:hypothetical protein n=1 Tax=Pseudomonas huaxiensis TaxID=2213017 RepID=UPI000DA69126|nr:hypothetical protein [Pseudomonas huaxiensis]